MKILIKNGRVIDPLTNIDDTLDILIQDGRIVEVKAKIDTSEAQTIDASRLVVTPGLIDMHVHLREPGFEYKETIASGAKAAARGGFTSIACMPNTSPPNDNRGVTEFILAQARKVNLVNVFPVAAITKGLQGKELTDMADLQAAGAIAFSDDGQPVSSSLIMRRALEYAQMLNTLIIDHCEDRELSAEGVMNEGEWSLKFGLQGIPAVAEEIIVARDILLTRLTGSPLHVAHLSTKGSLELLRWAKANRLPVTAEVTPHHLLLTDQMMADYDTNLKVNPPLRSEEDRQALLEGLRDGTIDVIATDHAPHAPDEKDVEFDQAPFGIIGLESALPVLLDRLVQTKIITLNRLVELLSTNPARLLKLKNKGHLQVGADADLTLIQLQKKHTLDVSQFASQSRNCPFAGWSVKGRAVMTIVGGRIVYNALSS
ncbi:MAG: dihydroorotase [Candidatus Aminicenantes bacterium]|nr:MAG: dihydroorotase [Candidatus Aminicenantes bacterium 4484_214]RLE03218.1 MAG: dihydroorotase [Candidatus Aminicenantes bacterium]